MHALNKRGVDAELLGLQHRLPSVEQRDLKHHKVFPRIKYVIHFVPPPPPCV